MVTVNAAALVRNNPVLPPVGLAVEACRRCGTPLSGPDGLRPVETYAGTATGLCDPCTYAPPQVVAERPDGLLEVDHPPATPAWSRERQRFPACPGCRVCLGLGARRVYSPNGPYLQACPACDALARWRSYLAAARQRWREWADRRLDELVEAAERARRAQRLEPGDASEAFLDTPLAREYRAILRAAWESKYVPPREFEWHAACDPVPPGLARQEV